MTTTTRKRARAGEGALLRDELLTAAEAVLDAEGEHAVTVRGIAARVGVSTPAVYMHFPSRQDLLHAVCLRVWDGLGQQMRDAVAETGDPLTALYQRCVAYIHFGLEHPLRYSLVMNGAATEASRKIAEDCFGYLAAGVEPCVTAGALIGEVSELTQVICASLHGAVALLVQQPASTWPADLDGYADRVANAVCLGAAGLGRIPAGRGLSLATLAQTFVHGPA
jgi:AcrR family transcriptional regulator